MNLNKFKTYLNNTEEDKPIIVSISHIGDDKYGLTSVVHNNKVYNKENLSGFIPKKKEDIYPEKSLILISTSITFDRNNKIDVGNILTVNDLITILSTYDDTYKIYNYDDDLDVKVKDIFQITSHGCHFGYRCYDSQVSLIYDDDGYEENCFENQELMDCWKKTLGTDGFYIESY